MRLAYQRVADDAWYHVSSDPLANTGQYDWPLPEGIHGPITVRLTAVDKGGQRVHSDRQVLEISPANPAGASASALSAVPASAPDSVRGDTISQGALRAKKRTARLFAEAIAHRDRDEYRDGISRLREAIRLRPQWTEVLAEMADMLYRVDDLDRALSAYQLALRQQPAMRRALRGAAMVHRRKNDPAVQSEGYRGLDQSGRYCLVAG